jgi:hypothetical protein
MAGNNKLVAVALPWYCVRECEATPAPQRGKDAAMSTVRGHVVRQISLALLVLSCGAAMVAQVTPAGSSTRAGLITGRVSECGPGPIVAPPGQSPPPPITVKVEHDDQVVAVVVVKFTNLVPRDGTFRFVVPAGTYEVLSSYRSQDRWVRVQAGGHSVVTFGLFACPLTGVKAGGIKAAASAVR